jgi:hypothetical protein
MPRLGIGVLRDRKKSCAEMRLGADSGPSAVALALALC